MKEEKTGSNIQTATFGAGCFWGVEETFRKIKGVVDTKVGYMGGKMQKPTYEDVCTDGSGHAEVVQVKYDPSKVKFEELLDVFWNNHNPTTTDRQGPDEGSQYRSVIFYYTEEQKKTAMKSKENLEKSKKFQNPVVTKIVKASEFWMAEDYHQRYLQKRGVNSCHI